MTAAADHYCCTLLLSGCYRLPCLGHARPIPRLLAALNAGFWAAPQEGSGWLRESIKEKKAGVACCRCALFSAGVCCAACPSVYPQVSGECMVWFGHSDDCVCRLSRVFFYFSQGAKKSSLTAYRNFPGISRKMVFRRRRQRDACWRSQKQRRFLREREKENHDQLKRGGKGN